jgi:anaerobic selenocysteine-containing dehydrogenase
MTYAKLLERGGIQWPCNDDNPDGTTRLYKKPVFPTKWQISEVYEKDLETGHEHTQQEYRKKRDPKGRAVLIASEFHEPAEAPDREYPFTAITGRQVYHWHTRTKTMKSPVLREAAPGVFVSINKADAKKLGIADGDIVRIVSRRAHVEAPARVGEVVARGTVFIPFHYGELDRNEAANNLMPKTHDAVSKQPVQKSAAVRIEKVRNADGRTWW